MSVDLRKALELQTVDREREAIARDLERIPKLRGGRKAEVDRTLRALEAAREEMRALELRVREAESRVKQWREELGRLGAQLDRVKNQREYDALNHEIDELNRKISDADDEGLEFLDEEETIEKRIAELERSLEVKKKAAAEELRRLDGREADKRRALDLFTGKSEAIAAGLDPEFVSRYRRLREKVGGDAVVPVVEGICGGCHMRLLARRLQEMDVGGGLATCDSCGRFLFDEKPKG